jgi:hypothetical protein
MSCIERSFQHLNTVRIIICTFSMKLSTPSYYDRIDQSMYRRIKDVLYASYQQKFVTAFAAAVPVAVRENTKASNQ